MASELLQTSVTLENRRKTALNKSKRNVKPKEKNIENDYGEEDEEKQYDTITEQEINRIKADKFSLRMPDLSKILPEDHFINVYAKYGSSVTDSYYEYHVMNAIWLLSTIAKCQVYLDLPQGIVRPTIWATNIGLSTISGKSLSINKARETYEKIFTEELPNTNYSVEGYYHELQENPYLNSVRDEVGGLYAKFNKSYNDGIYDDECLIYDGQGVKKRLKDKGGLPDIVEIENPCTTKLYGTTPSRFLKYITYDMMDGGYGLRLLYTFPTYDKDIKDLSLRLDKNNTEFNMLCDQANEIKKRFTISVRLPDEPVEPDKRISYGIESEALKYYNQINKELTTKYKNSNFKDSIMLSAWGRYNIYALKLAMLIEVGKKEYSDTISLETMKLAIQLITEYFLPTFKSLTELITEDAKNNNVERVLSTLKSLNNVAPRDVLLRGTKLTERTFNEVIDTLIRSDSIDVKIDEKTNKVMYILKTDEDRERDEENLIKDKKNILDKLKKKDNSSVWTEIKNNTHLDKSRFNKAIDSLLLERKIEVKEEHTFSDKPRKIISIIN